MIRVNVLFQCFGFASTRIYNSMAKYLPKDIELSEVLQVATLHSEKANNADLIVGNIGLGSFDPYWAYLSPKAVISEHVDDVTLSYFCDKDIIFLYDPEGVDIARKKGVDAVLWNRPVDPDIFYREDIPKIYEILSVGPYHGGTWTLEAEEAVCQMGGRHMILSPTNMPGIAEQDVCWPGRHDDKMRQYYCSSKYILSIQDRQEYRPGCTSYGHETANVEAAFCGSRPLAIDAPDAQYLKYWWGDFAQFIKLDGFKETITDILQQPYTPLSEDARQAAVTKYNACTVWDNFWGAVGEKYNA